MSKAEELAKKLGKEIERTIDHDVLMQDTLTHLRALDASHQRLKEALDTLYCISYMYHGFPVTWKEKHEDSLKRAQLALEQAKDLS